jgi:hypothetical protein
MTTAKLPDISKFEFGSVIEILVESADAEPFSDNLPSDAFDLLLPSNISKRNRLTRKLYYADRNPEGDLYWKEFEPPKITYSAYLSREEIEAYGKAPNEILAAIPFEEV